MTVETKNRVPIPPGKPLLNLPRGRSANQTLLAEKVRLSRAQADKLEIANAAARRELLPAAAVEAEWANVLRDVRAALLALPSRIGSRLPALTPHDIGVIEREVRDVLTEMAHAD